VTENAVLAEHDHISPDLVANYLDACLFETGQSGDERCFTEVYDYFSGRVKHFLLDKGLENSVAEKLTQDIMLALFRTSVEFDPTKTAASTWVFSIARDHWLTYYRGYARIEMDPDDKMFQVTTP